MTQAQITVNAGFAESVGEQGVRAYVAVLAEAATRGRGRTVTEIDEMLAHSFEEGGIAVDEMSRSRLAEQIAGLGEDDLVVMSPTGEDLLGHQAPEGTEAHTVGEEPEHPDRPVYS